MQLFAPPQETPDSDPVVLTVWQQLKQRMITCEQALDLLVNDQGIVDLSLLDPEVNDRFLREFADPGSLPYLMPLLLWRGCYYLGSPQPITSEMVQALAKKTLTEIKIIQIAPQSYRTWFHRQNLPDHGSISSAPLLDPFTGEPGETDIREVAELYLSQAASQARRINAIISSALQNRASDIHLEPTANGLRIRFRIDGILQQITTLSQDISRAVVVAIKVMSDMNIAESRRPQDGRIGRQYVSAQADQKDLDLRVSTLPCVHGEKAVIRLLHREENAFSDLSTLGFSAKTLETYRRWLHQPQGLIVITGPTGSGKTSTLYTSLHTIATEHVNVVTVEDPVEYILSNITQTQVHEKAGMTFSGGLRAILRQDPDIVMVGEIRDHDTAETVVRAALTGHLVLTTMHTNDSVSAIPRLKDLGPDPGLISDALLGITAQRLVRRICPHCAEPYEPTDPELQSLGLRRSSSALYQKGRGCGKCFKTGFLGREAVVELLDVDDMVRQLIYEGTLTQLQRYLASIAYDSFRISAIQKIVTGVTTIAEVRRVLPYSALTVNA